MNNKRFLFLVSWVHGSPAAEELGDETNVHDTETLLSEYKEGNESVLALEVFAPNSDVAEAIGWRHAIQEDAGAFTLNDTVSLVKELLPNEPVDLGATECAHISITRLTVTETNIVEEDIDKNHVFTSTGRAMKYTRRLVNDNR
jgi:hypothetical protein